MEEVELGWGTAEVPREGRWASDSAERFAIAKFGRRALSFFFPLPQPEFGLARCMAAAGGWGRLAVWLGLGLRQGWHGSP